MLVAHAIPTDYERCEQRRAHINCEQKQQTAHNNPIGHDLRIPPTPAHRKGQPIAALSYTQGATYGQTHGDRHGL